MKLRNCNYLCLCLLAFGMVGTSLSSAAISVRAGEEPTESLPGLLMKKALDPSLREDLKRLRFSPNGKYILAQDNWGILVLSREPFAVLFRIPAVKVSPAQFAPDSQSIVFHNSSALVEVWSVAEQKLKARHQVKLETDCNQTALSPDAKTVACYDSENDLILIDVATSARIFREAGFYKEPWEGKYVEDLTLIFGDSINSRINMAFSPDGRYFAAGLRRKRQLDFTERTNRVADATKPGFPNEYGQDSISGASRPYIQAYDPDKDVVSSKAVAYDLTSRKQVSLAGSLKKLVAYNFAFAGSDRIVGTQASGNSELAAFPAGDTITPMTLEKSVLNTSTGGNYVLLRPMGTHPVGVVDLKSGAPVMANKRPALDIYNSEFVGETDKGELGIFEIGTNKVLAKLQLPRSPLSDLRAVAMSPDFRYVAVSGNSQAGVWDLTKGTRVFHVRPFEGAYFADDGAFYVDFPGKGSVARTIGYLHPERGEILAGRAFPDLGRIRTEQYGQYVVITQPVNQQTTLTKNLTLEPVPNKQATMEVRDVRTLSQMWSKTFSKTTPVTWVDAPNDSLVLQWSAADDVAKVELKNDAKLSKQRSSVKSGDFIRFFQALDLSSGQRRGGIFVNTGDSSTFVRQAFVLADSFVLVDSNRQIGIYTLSTGELKTTLAGMKAVASRESGLLCVQRDEKSLTLIDLSSMKEREQFVFSGQVAFVRFSNDGKRLFVLTVNHEVYVLDVSAKLASPKT